VTTTSLTNQNENADRMQWTWEIRLVNAVIQKSFFPIIIFFKTVFFSGQTTKQPTAEMA